VSDETVSVFFPPSVYDAIKQEAKAVGMTVEAQCLESLDDLPELDLDQHILHISNDGLISWLPKDGVSERLPLDVLAAVGGVLYSKPEDRQHLLESFPDIFPEGSELQFEGADQFEQMLADAESELNQSGLSAAAKLALGYSIAHCRQANQGELEKSCPGTLYPLPPKPPKA
jgi:hypothetical protein